MINTLRPNGSPPASAACRMPGNLKLHLGDLSDASSSAISAAHRHSLLLQPSHSGQSSTSRAMPTGSKSLVGVALHVRVVGARNDLCPSTDRRAGQPRAGPSCVLRGAPGEYREARGSSSISVPSFLSSPVSIPGLRHPSTTGGMLPVLLLGTVAAATYYICWMLTPVGA